MNIGYNGNQNLKKSDTPVQWSTELIQEFAKCAADPIYFAKTYIKIVHVDRGLIPFDMYDYQQEIVEKIANNRRVAVLTARQSGKTTTAVAVILHYILFNEFKTVAILANKGDAATEVLSRIKLAYEALPAWLQQGVQEWNKTYITLENGCKIYAGTTSSSAIRGKSVNFLYLDEVAFIEGYDEFFASVYPTISSGETTKLLMTSTPNGMNHFWKTCKGAEEGTNGYKFVKVMWHDVPGRDEKWQQETIEALDHDQEKFNQEYCCQFLGSSGTLISGHKLKELSPFTPVAQNAGLLQYEKPVSGHSYALIADVSRGKGLDYSTVIYNVAKLYNEAYLLVEVNDIGGQVSDVIYLDYGYENMVFTENAGRTGKRVSGGFGKNVDRGIRTTKSVKSVGCSVLKMLIEQNQLILTDFNTIQELSRFSRRGVSYEAESGATDDLVMGLVLFAWLSDQTYFRDLTDINTMAALREKTEEEIEDDLLPFGFINTGIEDDEPMIQTSRWL